ncbi:rhomboid family intramembrane serine protease [candidate division TA06 bacterium]|uniref:Rhomboid family intramembrane serine protease n=1 Tax=candidate division TA06 bacterium TaxID=2250710 RepID=A0A933I937_UNCT6|nr:rhomboid family intramembrane serine protease [candidate division TA06 bacterium]
MIPLKDDIVSSRFPIVNTLLIAANALAFLFELSLGPGLSRFILQTATVPEQMLMEGVPGWPSIIYSMFLHSGWAHFLGNMLYLYIFGDNVEDVLGHFKYLAFYLLCGFGAAWAHIITEPGSAVPVVGASGAIAGVLGAYFLLYPKARVLTLVFFGFFVRIIKIPALAVLGLWIILQLVFGLGSLPQRGQGGGVAWFAHIGGFICGMGLLFAMGGWRKRQNYIAKSGGFWDN